MDTRSRRAPPAAFDDSASIRSRAYGSNLPHLRPAESRYSLREQFAMTRKEFEFGFDDAASVLERSTLASEAARGGDQDGPPTVGAGPDGFSDFNPVDKDCYELLCLPRDPYLPRERVRDAARRLMQVLAVDKQPPGLQGPAAFYLGLTQAAYETLANPSRKLGYDLSEANDMVPNADGDGAALEDEYSTLLRSSQSYESKLQDQYLLLTRRDFRSTADLALRVDAASLLPWQRGHRRDGSGLQALDFSLRKSAAVAVPALRMPIEKAVAMLGNLYTAGNSLLLTDPVLTITGATHGLLDEPFPPAAFLFDRYEPPGPSIHGRRRWEQLLASRFLAVLNLTLHQEGHWQRADPRPRALPDFVVEQELELLPHPSATVRFGHSIPSSGGDEPVSVEVSIQTPLLRNVFRPAPRIGLAVHKTAGPGTAFLVADSGDWYRRTSKECQDLSAFSKVLGGGFAPFSDAFRNPPTVEVGYAFGRQDLGIQSGQALTRPFERGLASLDCDIDQQNPSSWTLSAGLAPGNIAAYLRYSRDLFCSPRTSKPSPKHTRPGFRTEVELAGTVQGLFALSLRALKRTGRFSKAGLELSLSPHSLHLSLYWSRLGQRFNLPFLLFSPPTVLPLPFKARSTRLSLLLWLATAALPLASLAAGHFYLGRLRRNHRRAKPTRTTTTTTTTVTSSSTGGATKQPAGFRTRDTPASRDRLRRNIAQRRAEADSLTALLATGAQPRQQTERARGGLVVLSAKYAAARDAPPPSPSSVPSSPLPVSFLRPSYAHGNDRAGAVRYADRERADEEKKEDEEGDDDDDDDDEEPEVADVTVAVAALVDDAGRLVVPAGLDKGRLLGFWDPDPDPGPAPPRAQEARAKVLRVRYLWKGEERVAESRGREELRLP